MLPSPSEVPAAIILLAAGLLACFMGYRLFRWLLAVYGFIGGAWVTSLFVELGEPWMNAVAAVSGGLVGALLLLVVYLAGVAILGAGLGALAVNLFWTPAGDTAESWVIIVACLVGAIAAVSLQRYVIIVGTSFGGAWSALVGALALGGHTAAMAAAGGDPWQVYPMAPAAGQVGFAVGWFGLGLLAVLVQLRAASLARVGGPRRKAGDD